MLDNELVFWYDRIRKRALWVGEPPAELLRKRLNRKLRPPDFLNMAYGLVN